MNATPLPATPAPLSQTDKEPPPIARELVLVRLGALTTVHLPGPKVGLGEWLRSNAKEVPRGT
jgi:hypothetical protein